MRFYDLRVGLNVLCLTLCFSTITFAQFADLPEPEDTTEVTLVSKGAAAFSPVTDAVIRDGLSQLSGCLDFRVNGTVRGYVKGYVYSRPDKARRMLAKRLTYFPIFEETFKQHGIPTDLKYLAVVESALNPLAVSRVGATGLWQFMSYTAADYDMRMNGTVDERSNVVKSTEAAARYLKKLYAQYNDWALALAAYNSGPTRVSAAIRKAHSSNFWRIQRYLPAETRNYVPAFIAATYLCNFFELHGLTPDHIDLDQQLTDYIRVYEGLSFRAISEATGLDYATVKALNPGFKRDYVPPTSEGQYVTLPQRLLPAFVRYLNGLGGGRSYSYESPAAFMSDNLGDGRYYQSNYQVAQVERLETFAQKIGASAEHLRAWNKLSSSTLYPNQMLSVWRPVIVQKHTQMRVEAPGSARMKPAAPGGAADHGAAPMPAGDKATAPATGSAPAASQLRAARWHTVRRNESLEDIARQYDVSVESLRALNKTDNIKVGMRLKIKEM